MRQTPGTEISLAEMGKLFNWDGSDLSHTIYMLMCSEQLMIARRDITNPEQQTQEVQLKLEFSMKFLQAGGFTFFYDLFTTLSKQDFDKDLIRTKCLAHLLKLINHLLSIKPQNLLKQISKSGLLKVLIVESMNIIQSFIFTLKKQ
jgi:hypothetical protein